MLPARHDDDDIYIYIIFIFRAVPSFGFQSVSMLSCFIMNDI